MTFLFQRRLPQMSVAILAAVGVFLSVACSGPAEPSVKDNKVEPVGKQTSPLFGGSIHRNLANPKAENIAGTWSVEEDMEKNILWKAQLGTTSYGGPVVVDGRIFMGTNNSRPRNAEIKGDKGVLMCFRASDGKFLWQHVHDKLEEELDAHACGVASSPVVEGDRLYYVSNQCEVICANVADGKILWRLDMIKELKVYPGGLSGGLANCSPLIAGDHVILCTSNGTDAEDGKVEHPDAPSFLAVHKETGKVAWKSDAPGTKIMDGQWSSPAAAKVDGRTQVIFGGGDGWLYSFDAKSGELVWKFDCNPKAAVYKPGGRGDRNYIVATPVIYDNKCYVAVGQEPESGVGIGHLWCVDITKKPTNKEKDLSPVKDNFDPKADVNKNSGLVWHYGGEAPEDDPDGREFIFGRTISTLAIHDDLVYAAELSGYLHCVDAKTGKRHWMFDLRDSTWNSPYYADGKVFMGTDAGEMYVIEASKKKPEKPEVIDMLQSLKTPPVAVNGVLYLSNGLYLFAIKQK